MRVAIAGAGLTGAYLYRCLQGRYDVDIFDREKSTRCGAAPCAWGTSKEFGYYANRAGLEPNRYVRHVTSSVYLDDVALNVDLITFDKPRFVKDLLDGAVIRYAPLHPENYDRVIDATGAWRAFLPPSCRDIRVPGLQYLVETQKTLQTRISFVKIGYGWCFALSENRYHIGCACLSETPQVRLQELGWLHPGNGMKILCDCSGMLRVASAHDSQPFVIAAAGSSIWGVGEAIGCVSPLVGEGIVPGLQSVEILLKHWDNGDGYTKAILAAFDWMREERAVVDRLVAGKRLGIRDAWIVKKNSNRMGITVGLEVALRLMRRLR